MPDQNSSTVETDSALSEQNQIVIDPPQVGFRRTNNLRFIKKGSDERLFQLWEPKRSHSPLKPVWVAVPHFEVK